MPAVLPSSFLYAIASLIWGSTWMAITFQLGTVDPAASVGYRFLLAGGLFLLWSRWRGEACRLPLRTLRWVALQGVLLFGISYTLTYEAERHIASGLMAVLNSSMLLFNLIGMRLAFGRRLDGKSLLGAGLGCLGIVLVFWPELSTVDDASGWLGVACGLSAAVLASIGNLVAQRQHQHGVPLLAGTGWAMILGGATALLIALAKGQSLAFDTRPGYILSLLYLALFGSVFAFAAYFTLLGRIGAGRAGYVAVAVPILALILSAFFEGFVWQLWTVLGIACAVAGNLIMLLEPGQLRWLERLRRKPATQPAP
ncbi:DMT family transporter [Uliginosibacterium sp. 31-12]|uniref:DMT family transporter n=1 Tax=Uliginosibacterium sp. 31-12 TaxID=3062781 RepID=UPI0026E12B72|nr:EamA family transporter [Uliginosibacterium sp. 31-12]MDO6386642.1 EamA family transporter [Uliginosibacterium sp. 31-12]